MARLAVLSLHTSPLAQPGAGDGGGMNVYVRELAAALARRGDEVDVFTRRETPQAPRRRGRAGRPRAPRRAPAPPPRRQGAARRARRRVHLTASSSACGDVASPSTPCTRTTGSRASQATRSSTSSTCRCSSRSTPPSGSRPRPRASLRPRAAAEAAIVACADAVLASCEVEAAQLTSVLGVPDDRVAHGPPRRGPRLLRPG